MVATLKRVYISGPMTGLPEFNYPEFHRVAAKLRALGYAVVNPAELAGTKKLEWHEYMRNDIRWLMDCDAIALLDGWPDSKGAQLELEIAQTLGMEVIDDERVE